MLDENMINRILDVDWLSNVGNVTDVRSSNYAILKVESEDVVNECMKSMRWENSMLEFMNNMFESLFKINKLGKDEYNNVLNYVKSVCIPEILGRLVISSSKLDIDLLKSDFSHTLIPILITVYYDKKGFKELPTPLLEMYEVIKGGNLPCGWLGKIGTGGTLLIY